MVATIRIVGSISRRSGTWLWSWANESIVPEAQVGVHLLQTFGEQHGFERLATASFDAEEADGWELASIACLLLGGDGVYRIPSETSFAFVVLSDPHFVDPAGPTQ
jgi:hypothetical protein